MNNIDNDSDNSFKYDNINKTNNYNYNLYNIIPYIISGGVVILFISKFYIACKLNVKQKKDNNKFKSFLIDTYKLTEDILELECCICLNKLYLNNEKIIKLNCGHYYHNNCIIKSKNYGHDFCPLCRKNIL